MKYLKDLVDLVDFHLQTCRLRIDLLLQFIKEALHFDCDLC